MNAEQAARRIGVTERTVRRWIERGEVRAQKVGREFVIDPDDLARIAAERARPSRTAVYQEALASALYLLRAFNHETDAEALEREYGLTYIAPKPEVHVT